MSFKKLSEHRQFFLYAFAGRLTLPKSRFGFGSTRLLPASSPRVSEGAIPATF